MEQKIIRGFVADHNLARHTGTPETTPVLLWKTTGEQGMPHTPATLIIGEGKLYTEEQVRGILDEVKTIAAEHSQKCYTNRIEQMTPPAPVAFLIDKHIAAKHDITL